jgi:hypothetical protein
VPEAGSEEHRIWRENVVAGVRRAKLKRRAAGLLSLTEAAVETCLPVSAVRKVFPVFYAGGKPYVRQRYVTQWLIETGGETAAEERIA